MRNSSWIILGITILTAIVLIPSRVIRPRPQELTMATWGMPFEDRLFQDGYARGFEELKPGWTVNYQRHSQIVDKYNAWHVQRRGADVMRMGMDYYHSFVEKGMIAPLSEFIKDPEVGLTDEEIADYFPTIWEELVLDDEIYALPSDNAQYGLYYSRDAFDNWNAAHPDDVLEYPHAGWTWDSLYEASRKLTVQDANGRTLCYGVMFELWAWPFLTFLHQAGGRTWDADKTTTLVNSREGVEALEFLVQLVPEDAPIKAAELAASAASPAELFKTGRLAMLLDGSWRSPNIDLDAPDLNYAIAPLPHYRRHAVVSGSVLWAVSAHSPNKRKAWEMIKWMTNREQSLRYWDTLRVAPPARLSVIHSEGFKSTPGFVDEYGLVRIPPMPREKYDDLARWLEHAITPDPETSSLPGFVPAAPYQFDLQTKVTTALIAATRGEMSAEDALDQAAREIHAIIDRDRAARGLPPVKRE